MPKSVRNQATGRGPCIQSGAAGILIQPFSEDREVDGLRPSRYPAGDWQPAGLAFEDAWFTAKDGTRLHGWYVPHPQPRAVVLFCHGNGGNVALWADVLRILHDRMGVTAMGFDYRGYGRSEGTPSEAGVLADARAARTWLAQRAGIAENQIVLMGRSLGGAVAVDLAAEAPVAWSWKAPSPRCPKSDMRRCPGCRCDR